MPFLCHDPIVIITLSTKNVYKLKTKFPIILGVKILFVNNDYVIFAPLKYVVMKLKWWDDIKILYYITVRICKHLTNQVRGNSSSQHFFNLLKIYSFRFISKLYYRCFLTFSVWAPDIFRLCHSFIYRVHFYVYVISYNNQ